MTSKAERGMNLTGVWNGLYSYSAARGAVGFGATLIESGRWLSGSVQEPGATAGALRLATLLGEHSDGSVRFVKTYDPASGWTHQVHYDGRLSEDGTEIEGTWSVPGSWSGRFLMLRPEGRPVSEAKKSFERL